MLDNPFGQFDPSGRTFTIHDPATPAPWVNVISNGRYGLVVSQNGGGFSWLDNSQLSVLTRWDMDLVRDSAGRFLYLADRDSGDLWSLAPAPCRPRYERYSCAHTIGSTTFTTEHRGVRAEWRLCVPPGDTAELWAVSLTNLESRPRRLRIASYFEWCCGAAPDAKREFHRLFITTRHDAGRRAILATKNMWDVPARHEGEHWNRPWPFVAAHAVCGAVFERDLATADKAAFLGRYGDPARPAFLVGDGALQAGPTPFGRCADACACLGGDLTLAPGETRSLHYILAAAESEERVLALLDRYAATAQAGAASHSSQSFWERLLAPTSIQSEMPDLDLLCGSWLPYQAISGRLWGRTGYYQQSGAYGYRDQLQDSQVWLTLEPDRCREQILLHAAHQFADGSVYHWWHPLSESGLRTACSDDLLWLPFVVAAYVNETGDLGVLARTAPFVDDPVPATVLEHCRRSFARSFEKFSARGLPLIGSCDWNDGLSAVGVAGKGESVWLGFFLAGLLEDFASVLERAGHTGSAGDYRHVRAGLVAAINQHAWDGEWFRCATLDSGEWIGSRESQEGRIFLNMQTWAILTGATTPQRQNAAWDSVRRYLLSDWGPLLLAPAYTEPRADIGYITRYSPGARENGGVYMHAATWALAAACKRRDLDAVSRIWDAVSPPRRCADAEAYRAEPYVLPGNVDGPRSDTPGKAGWTWYTGSAAWLRKVVMEWVLGLRAAPEGLLVDPCPPAELGRVEFTRPWRGRQVRLRFDAREFTPDAALTVAANGVTLCTPVLVESLYAPGTLIDVVATWGAGERPHRPPTARRAAV
jgi:cellobiose phosphorylase